MPVTALVRQQPRPLGRSGSLMARCLAAGLPVASSCSGRGSCGQCRVRILEGWNALTPLQAHEAEVLSRNGGGPSDRLACQARVAEDATEILIATGYW